MAAAVVFYRFSRFPSPPGNLSGALSSKWGFTFSSVPGPPGRCNRGEMEGKIAFSGRAWPALLSFLFPFLTLILRGCQNDHLPDLGLPKECQGRGGCPVIARSCIAVLKSFEIEKSITLLHRGLKKL